MISVAAPWLSAALVGGIGVRARQFPPMGGLCGLALAGSRQFPPVGGNCDFTAAGTSNFIHGSNCRRSASLDHDDILTGEEHARSCREYPAGSRRQISATNASPDRSIPGWSPMPDRPRAGTVARLHRQCGSPIPLLRIVHSISAESSTVIRSCRSSVSSLRANSDELNPGRRREGTQIPPGVRCPDHRTRRQGSVSHGRYGSRRYIASLLGGSP